MEPSNNTLSSDAGMDTAEGLVNQEGSLRVEYLVIQTLSKLVYRQLRIFSHKFNRTRRSKERRWKTAKGIVGSGRPNHSTPKKQQKIQSPKPKRKTSCLLIILVPPNRVISYGILEHHLPNFSYPSLRYRLASSRFLLPDGPALDSKADKLPR